nr:activase [Propionibacterium sp.]
MQSSQLALGLDIGSTTVKAVVLREGAIVFSDYRRHHADVRGELRELIEDVRREFGAAPMTVGVTGSGGLHVAELMGVDFFQEVIAATEVIERLHPTADVVIELGGEDAKITYLKPVPEQRMNGTCAGGTGAFIDQMATLLHTDASGLNDLAAEYTHLYPIASRCGVFAKSDVQPLLNQGAEHTDLAASVFQAVATQTIAGLACGRPIRGNIVFLGGPLHFLPELRKAYERALAGSAESFTTPRNAQLYVALGAAQLSSGRRFACSELIAALDAAGKQLTTASSVMRPLFADDAERAAFEARHALATVPQGDLTSASGPCFLGIDAGSTTIKCVVLNADDEIVFSHYASNQGDPVTAAVDIVRRVRESLPADAHLGRSCVTGYGEGLVRAALRVDDGEIETMAHYRAAEKVAPGVTSVIDIGGQDMKYLRIRNGAVDSIAVNEACSSGCGSFLQTFAQTMNHDVASFSRAALQSTQPVDLGSRCTVFMNSSVKQAQKEGAGVGDISAGLSYSVVRNALYKVIKLRDAGQLGAKVVVQGGTFLNDAVLRAFELLTGVEVVRPDIAGLMGAYGAALTAKRAWLPGQRSSLMELDELTQFTLTTERRVCTLCQNHCGLTISHFNDGSRHVSGNRCERGASEEARPRRSEIPNLYDYKYRRIFSYRRLTDDRARRGTIGIPRVLNMYENYPFWFTVLTHLGFKVVLSGRSSHEVFEAGMESIPSENVCYPAKLAHGHLEHLLAKGVRTIFYPCVTNEQQSFEAADNNFNCPIVAFYPQVLAKNVDALREAGVRYLDPFVNLANPEKLAERLVEIFESWDVTPEEAREAVRLGYEEDQRFKEDVRAEGRRALQYMVDHGCKGIVLAGRPYHVDPEINHGIPEIINQLGMVVLSEDAITDVPRLERPLRVRDQWAYHTRLYEAAAFVRSEPALQLVQLNSFGCGIDAVTTDQVQEILEAADDVYTVLKIDEVSNLGAATIRLRSLKAATAERRPSAEVTTFDAEPAGAWPVYTKQARREHTLYAPQMAPIHFRLLQPVFQRLGYRVELLEHASKDDTECGLKYVNNDVCYPAIMVIGQLINKFETGGGDPDNSSVVITQTGGMCRATNYAGMLRKGLKDAGFGQVPVLAMSAQGLEEAPGFKITPALIHRGLQALVIGDVIQNCLLRVRPYEKAPGSAQVLYRKWDALVTEFFTYGGYSPTLERRIGYGWILDHLVAEFDALPLTDEPRRPRVGLVGEILVKFQPDANNHAVEVIENEGCEAVLPGLLDFFCMSMYTSQWRLDNLGIGTGGGVRGQKAMLWLIDQYTKPAHRALARAGGKFHVPPDIATMARRAESVISLGTTAGEGWLLVAEMIDLIETGTPNIVCAQPFACLPNHVVGKGVFRELRRLYPQANVTSIDYDPGASEVNQLNRIKLMVATAHKNASKRPQRAQPETELSAALR